MGGIGGVIRDWKGKVVNHFLGPVNSLDANGAEMLAMLLGCHELRNLGGHNAIIEGDSLSPIQWG